MLRRKKAILAASVAALCAAGATAAGIAIIKPYAVGVDGGYHTQRLLSVGDAVPETSNASKQFQMIGIPDGLGAYKSRSGRTTLFMNHELLHNTLSEPVLGEPLNRGPIVSKLTLDRKGKVLSGERAYDTVYTVIMSMEDGPASQDRSQGNSQLYMYVGEKDRSRGATVLERNGLVGGTLYVFRSKDPARNSESTFLNGTIEGEWVSLGNVGALSDVQLEAASDAANAMIFARPEDGAFNLRNDDQYFFVTTGEGTGNALGRLYSLELSGRDSTGSARLTVEYNADQVIAAGGDIAVSPDNIDVSRDHLMINEDGTATSRAVMASKQRDGSIWRFDVDRDGVEVESALRIAELNPPGRDRVPVGHGVWETSGIIDATKFYGENTWIFDVQAHPPTTPPKPNTVEDGQLLMLIGPDDDGGDRGDDD